MDGAMIYKCLTPAGSGMMIVMIFYQNGMTPKGSNVYNRET
jgi:hypothetical protein